MFIETITYAADKVKNTWAYLETVMPASYNELNDIVMKLVDNNNLLGTIYAKINSPALTGTPTAPTPATGDSSTKIATTEFVRANSLIPTALDWKQAYTGRVTTINTVFCTLPSSWKEVIIKYDWSGGRSADSFFLIPRAALDVTRQNVPSDNEIYIRIDSSNQITMSNRGDSGDAIVKGVYYR